ncbi:MAG TPA: hypothetical protein VMS17_24380 [Gemmataceae bacterium]|nr:hypothetical protein [Gemmataceae bacterium]
MNHATLLGVLKARRHLAHVMTGVRHRQRAFLFQHLGKALSAHELHHHHVQLAGLFRVVGGDDVRLGQLRRRLDLAAEALHRAGLVEQRAADELDDDLPVHQPLPRLVDDARARRGPTLAG